MTPGREQRGQVHLLPQRGDHPLLPVGAVEVGGQLAGPGVGQRVAPVHVLDAGRHVELHVPGRPSSAG